MFFLPGFVWTGLNPLWAAVSNRCDFGERIHWFCVDWWPTRVNTVCSFWKITGFICVDEALVHVPTDEFWNFSAYFFIRIRVDAALNHSGERLQNNTVSCEQTADSCKKSIRFQKYPESCGCKTAKASTTLKQTIEVMTNTRCICITLLEHFFVVLCT